MLLQFLYIYGQFFPPQPFLACECVTRSKCHSCIAANDTAEAQECPLITDASLPSNLHCVVDGGYMLHKVRWTASTDMCDILPLYLHFLSKLGSGVSVIFDRYDEHLSAKTHEHDRRAHKCTKVVAKHKLDFFTKQIGMQEPFLENVTNKRNLVTLLGEYLTSRGVTVHQASENADTLVVSVALEKALSGQMNVCVLAEDTNILVLLLHHWQQCMNDIYLLSQAKEGRGGKIDRKCISQRLRFGGLPADIVRFTNLFN